MHMKCLAECQFPSSQLKMFFYFHDYHIGLIPILYFGESKIKPNKKKIYALAKD